MLQKQSVIINFAQGLNTKSDPFQLPAGQFLELENSVFTTENLLQKRNGFGLLPQLPTADATSVTTFNGNLTAIGPTLQALSAGSQSWVDKGAIQGVSIDTLSLVRSNNSQVQADTAISSRGLVCVAYTETVPQGRNPVNVLKYAIYDSNTGQNIVEPAEIPVTSGTPINSPRVFLLGNYFVIVFGNLIAATNHLQYVAIPLANPSQISANVDISSTFVPQGTLTFDGVVSNGRLFLSWRDSGGGGNMKVNYLTQTLQLGTPVTFAGRVCTAVSVTADETVNSPIIYVSFINSSGGGGDDSGWILAVNYALNTVLSPTQIITAEFTVQITSAAQNGVCTVFYEVSNTYGYDTSIPTDYIKSRTVTQAGVLGTAAVVLRSVGLASKAFISSSEIYFLSTYISPYQPTYFLSDAVGNVAARLAYSNALGFYFTMGLPSVAVENGRARVSYLFKNTIQAVNKTTNPPSGTQTAGIYSQVGVNLASFQISSVDNPVSISNAEIGENLNISGGFLWMYDGMIPVEQGFNVYPDSVETEGASNSGSLIAGQTYYYQAIYEWIDNQGNSFKSAPSIPVSFQVVAVTTTFTADTANTSDTLTNVSSFAEIQVGQEITGAGIPANTFIVSFDAGLGEIVMSNNATATAAGVVITNAAVSSANIFVPTLRLTYKIANPVKITIYRWQTSQPVYYQITPVIGVVQPDPPLLNDPTVDYVTWVDGATSASILGNNIIYTNGGVLENICPPGTDALTLFDDRLWLIDAEDKNLLWFSKQVLQATPVEFSDLQTIYVAPTLAAQGNTGPLRALAAMDDKIILFKKNAIYYINGTGPDITGANSQYSQPVFITSTVGTDNPQSVVLTPQGIMFQSDKGIWLLSRGLETTYIGAPVERYNSATVLSALAIPGTNEVRLTLDTGVTLMFDYFYKQWGTFTGVPAISSTLYEEKHTSIDTYGRVFQETPGEYLDGANPVLMKFVTGWLNLAGFQGYQRAFFFYLLGTYYSPHKLNLEISYNFNSSPEQATLVTPVNYAPKYGDISPYGQGEYGGPGNIENWRIFLKKQRCQSIQLRFTEVFDPSLGEEAGKGLSLSGINLVVAAKKSFRPISNAQSAGK